ncbi:MAG: hypothetical protein O2913_11010 [Chloroflexi bacterium]|nr:hypothetical protein [Chloroflexota bacterium]
MMDEKETEVIAKAGIAYLISQQMNLEASLLSRSRLSLEMTNWDLAFAISGEGEVTFCDYSAVLLVPPDRLQADRKALTANRSKNIAAAIREAIQGLFTGSQTVVQSVEVAVRMDMAISPTPSETDGTSILGNLGDFDHSEDYREIHWRDRDYPLGPLQAEVVAILHQAFRTSTRGLSWQAISSRITVGPSRMSDIFKKSDYRSELIVFQKQGKIYRLNI